MFLEFRMLLEGVKDILIFPWMSKIIKMSGTPELGGKQTFMKRTVIKKSIKHFTHGIKFNHQNHHGNLILLSLFF